MPSAAGKGVFDRGVISDALLYHAAMHHACLFGCAAGCNASQQRHYHCSSSSYFPSFPYVRAPRAGTEAGGCTPLTCGQLLAPIWETHLWFVATPALRVRSTVRVRELCSAWLCWQLAWADLGAGRVPREIFRAHSSLPCLVLASMTSWRVS